MNENLALTYIIPEQDISRYVSPETYLETDPETGITWVYYNGNPIVELGGRRALDNVWVHPEPGFQHGRCKMIRSNGERCKQPVRVGWTVCKYHGAGTHDSPAGRPPVTGNYSKHLPTRYMHDFEEYLHDPNLLSMRKEMALLDVRMGELLERLETSDAPQAWMKIAVAAAMLEKVLKDKDGKFNMGTIDEIVDILHTAITAHKDDKDTWHELVNLIDNRRKVADVERRRVEAAKKYLTLQEANTMLAYFVNSVMKNVSSPTERSRISEDLRIFAGNKVE